MVVKTYRPQIIDYKWWAVVGGCKCGKRLGGCFTGGRPHQPKFCPNCGIKFDWSLTDVNDKEKPFTLSPEMAKIMKAPKAQIFFKFNEETKKWEWKTLKK